MVQWCCKNHGQNLTSAPRPFGQGAFGEVWCCHLDDHFGLWDSMPCGGLRPAHVGVLEVSHATRDLIVGFVGCKVCPQQ